MLVGCSGPVEPAARDKYPTIVSLNPCTDAILAEVTGQGQLRAVSHYSQDAKSTSMDLATARQYPATGGTVEEIVALAPDMVVGSSFMAPATRAALTDLGIRVETVGIAASIDDSRAQIADLADMTGHPEKGAALIARIDAAVRDTQTDHPRSAVLWQPAGIVAGEGALVGELLAIAGFTSHSAAMGLGQADYLSLEQVLADPPDVLLLAGQERGQHHPALGTLAKTGAIDVAGFSSSLLYCGGPTIIRALGRLRAIRNAA
ncbi:MAG: ABC transporter substrate-binding protein [Pontixanthobacter sp.]